MGLEHGEAEGMLSILHGTRCLLGAQFPQFPQSGHALGLEGSPKLISGDIQPPVTAGFRFHIPTAPGRCQPHPTPVPTVFQEFLEYGWNCATEVQ